MRFRSILDVNNNPVAIPLTPKVAAAAANTATVVTVAKDANTLTANDATTVSYNATYFMGYSASWSGGVPTGSLTLTVSDGTTTVTFAIPNVGGNQFFNHPIQFKANADLTCTLAAGGASIIGTLNVFTFYGEPLGG